MDKVDKWLLLVFSLCFISTSASYAAGEDRAATGAREQPARQESGDQTLAARVEAALRADSALSTAINLAVTASDGQVTLAGSVKDAAQAERALEVARNVKGVKEVQDKLVRENDTGVPATSHQSTTTDAPLSDNPVTKESRSQ